MTRVLVTGAGGFVGRHVMAALASAGRDVHAVASTAQRHDGGDVTWHEADLLNAVQRETLVAAVRADALVHLAWCARPPDYWRHPDNLRWLTASLELVRVFAEQGGTRVVGAGTCAEYDWRSGYCTEETTPLVPATLYGTAKAACGSALNAYGLETGLSVAWGRLFFLFGPHDSPARLIPSLVTALHAGEPARCAAGSHVRDFLHVADAAAALVALLDSQITGPVNIASGIPVRVGDLARGVASRVGRPDLLSVEEGSPTDAMVAANISRLRDGVGWRPSLDAAAALDDTVRWWRSAEAAQVST
ncbi:MAG: NAD(P)-dependent oxidoreductase [Vicinamibacterales bacterium]